TNRSEPTGGGPLPPGSRGEGSPHPVDGAASPATSPHSRRDGAPSQRVPRVPPDLRRSGEGVPLGQGNLGTGRGPLLPQSAGICHPVHGASRVLTLPRHAQRAAGDGGPSQGFPGLGMERVADRRLSRERPDLRGGDLLSRPHERPLLPPHPPRPDPLQGRHRVHRARLSAGDLAHPGQRRRRSRHRGIVTPESIGRSVARDRRPDPAPSGEARRYVNQWVEAEAIGPERVRAFVLILRTRGCYWADVKGCSMCGYAKDTLGRSATPEELAEQLSRALARYRDEPYVKIYTSGSFLDDREVDPTSRTAIVTAFSGRARKLLFETLPEFARPETMNPLRDAFAGELEVALGLESTDPTVLGRFVNKGSPPSEYLAAADRLASIGVRRKAYLLLKPPYLAESEAVADVVRSVREAAPHFDSISVNPVHIQNGTVVEWLYRRGRYRPPWLWSLVDV